MVSGETTLVTSPKQESTVWACSGAQPRLYPSTAASITNVPASNLCKGPSRESAKYQSFGLDTILPVGNSWMSNDSWKLIISAATNFLALLGSWNFFFFLLGEIGLGSSVQDPEGSRKDRNTESVLVLPE